MLSGSRRSAAAGSQRMMARRQGSRFTPEKMSTRWLRAPRWAKGTAAFDHRQAGVRHDRSTEAYCGGAADRSPFAPTRRHGAATSHVSFPVQPAYACCRLLTLTLTCRIGSAMTLRLGPRNVDERDLRRSACRGLCRPPARANLCEVIRDLIGIVQPRGHEAGQRLAERLLHGNCTLLRQCP